jgi:uncharacterized protein
MTNKSNGHQWNTLHVRIDGMHCANCEVLIERRFKKIAGVRRVRASYASGRAEIVAYGHLDINVLQNAVSDDGYTVSHLSEQTIRDSESKNTHRDYVEIGALFLIFVALYVILQQFDLLPDHLAVPNTISYGLAFLIGVVASISTCIAVTGGLLVAVAAKYNAASRHFSRIQSFKPHIYFNAGRIASYTLLGGVIGALGSTFTLSAEANGLLILVASGVMIVLGLQMLNLFPSLKLFRPRMPKFLAHKIHDQAERNTKGGAFLLGASTFFLPCGFTQALQLYVLAQGSFATGALTMLVFSLGTLPALLSLSAMSSFATGGLQRYFLKVAGVAVVILGFFNIQSGLTLTTVSGGASTSTVDETQQAAKPVQETVPVVDGKQIVDMKIVGYTYQPHRFFVTQELPVEWRIDASLAAGCGRILIAPKAGVRKMLPSGITVVTFTPQEPGDIRFNCGMGMMDRGSAITVLAGVRDKSAQSQPAAEKTVAQGVALASEAVKATLAESMKLAEALGLSGTPSYVIGSNVVIGAAGLDALREKVNAVRK